MSDPQTPPPDRQGSWRWALGTVPWFVIVGCLALVEGLGCAPVDDPEPEDSTPDSYGDDDDAATDDDDFGGPYPAIFRPDVDAIEASRIQPIWVDFSQEIEGAVISIAGPDGAVPLRSQQVGAVRVLAMPDRALAPSTTYTATVRWDASDAFSWAFTTAAARPATPDPVGVTIAWDLPDAAASSPPGAEAFVGSLPLRVLTELGGSAAGLTVLAAMADEDDPLAQDLCVPSFEPTATEFASWDAPLLQTPPSLIRLTVDLSIVGFGIVMLPLRSVRFLAELHGEGAVQGLAEGAFFGFVDGREVGIPGVCDTLGGVAIDCVACPGDGAEHCLYFALEDIEGEVVPVDLVARSAAQVKADPGCLPEAAQDAR